MKTLVKNKRTHLGPVQTQMNFLKNIFSPKKSTSFSCNDSLFNAAKVLFYLKRILEANSIPNDIYYFMVQFIIPLFPLLQWDTSTCNEKVIVHEDKLTLSMNGSGWEHSVLGSHPNVASFSVLLIEPNSIAIGYAPREGFEIHLPTMYTKGIYMYTGATLYHGGLDCKKKETKQFGPKKSYFGYSVNTLITCYLNVNERTLGFKCNGEDYGIGYTDIDMSAPLFPAVSAVGPCKIKLILDEHNVT